MTKKSLADTVKAVKSRVPVIIDEIALDASDIKPKPKKVNKTNSPDGSPSGAPKSSGKMQNLFVENIIKNEVDPKTAVKAIFWPDQPTDIRDKLTLTAVERISEELAASETSNVEKVSREFDGGVYTAFYYVPDNATEEEAANLKSAAASMLEKKVEDTMNAKSAALLLAVKKEEELVEKVRSFLHEHGGPIPVKVLCDAIGVKPSVVSSVANKYDSTFVTDVLKGQSWIMLNTREHIKTFRYQKSSY